MVNVKLIQDLDNEGSRGRKYSMLVIAEAERLHREAKPARDKVYPGPNSRVSLGRAWPSREHTSHQCPGSCYRGLVAWLRRQCPQVEKPPLKTRPEPQSCF